MQQLHPTSLCCFYEITATCVSQHSSRPPSTLSGCPTNVANLQFKPSRLSSLALDRPTKSGVKGRLDRGGSYTLVNASEEGEGIGAEMAGMSLLVPNMKAGGKLQRGECLWMDEGGC